MTSFSPVAAALVDAPVVGLADAPVVGLADAPVVGLAPAVLAGAALLLLPHAAAATTSTTTAIRAVARWRRGLTSTLPLETRSTSTFASP